MSLTASSADMTFCAYAAKGRRAPASEWAADVVTGEDMPVARGCIPQSAEFHCCYMAVGLGALRLAVYPQMREQLAGLGFGPPRRLQDVGPGVQDCPHVVEDRARRGRRRRPPCQRTPARTSPRGIQCVECSTSRPRGSFSQSGSPEQQARIPPRDRVRRMLDEELRLGSHGEAGRPRLSSSAMNRTCLPSW